MPPPQLSIKRMTTQKENKKRVQVIYSGMVQGVGFRFSAEAIAQELGVEGYVKNLRDGRVELVAEADEKSINEFLKKIDEKMKYYISNREIEYSKATGEFKNFEIRF